MPPHLLAHASRLREQGYRVTPQRQLILDAVGEGHGHQTLDQIARRIHAKTPTINRATVYRGLDFLCEMRLVVAMQVGRKMYYELAGETPHHHLVCRTCGQVAVISHDDVRPLFERITAEQGFVVDMDHLSLFGLCAHCRSAHGSATGMQDLHASAEPISGSPVYE